MCLSDMDDSFDNVTSFLYVSKEWLAYSRLLIKGGFYETQMFLFFLCLHFPTFLNFSGKDFQSQNTLHFFPFSPLIKGGLAIRNKSCQRVV